jgi:hypothetical protein
MCGIREAVAVGGERSDPTPRLLPAIPHIRFLCTSGAIDVKYV